MNPHLLDELSYLKRCCLKKTCVGDFFDFFDISSYEVLPIIPFDFIMDKCENCKRILKTDTAVSTRHHCQQQIKYLLKERNFITLKEGKITSIK